FTLKETGICKNFISYFLNSSFGISYFERCKIGAIQGNITIPVINNFHIPLPPLVVQEQIAKEIAHRRERAKNLQQEAKEILESAKKQVESIILGG
ncbi:MAG: restriction endonuclease subunit S, partial [Clostridia bacterium]|nr:restriction endonuclease subunit S [Clostridia bacterium]